MKLPVDDLTLAEILVGIGASLCALVDDDVPHKEAWPIGDKVPLPGNLFLFLYQLRLKMHDCGLRLGRACLSQGDCYNTAS
jgi:hypothetical protein